MTAIGMMIQKQQQLHQSGPESWKVIRESIAPTVLGCIDAFDRLVGESAFRFIENNLRYDTARAVMSVLQELDAAGQLTVKPDELRQLRDSALTCAGIPCMGEPTPADFRIELSPDSDPHTGRFQWCDLGTSGKSACAEVAIRIQVRLENRPAAISNSSLRASFSPTLRE